MTDDTITEDELARARAALAKMGRINVTPQQAALLFRLVVEREGYRPEATLPTDVQGDSL